MITFENMSVKSNKRHNSEMDASSPDSSSLLFEVKRLSEENKRMKGQLEDLEESNRLLKDYIFLILDALKAKDIIIGTHESPLMKWKTD